MLLTAAASSFAARIKPVRGGASTSSKATLSLVDLPAFIKNEVGLGGIAMTTPLLAGCDRALLERIVQAADKVGCPCLSLIEPEPQALYETALAEVAEERVKRVVQAAQWLGCSNVSIRITAPDDEDAMLEVAERLRPIVRKAEKMDLNFCIGSAPGMTGTAERITELLKKIGGFRVGTLPDFASAGSSGDAGAYLRRLVPYASTVLATITDTSIGETARTAATTSPAPPKPKAKPKKSKSKDGDTAADEGPAAPVEPAARLSLADCVSVVDAVGFDGSLAFDYTGKGDAVAALTRAKELVTKLFLPPELPVDDEMGLDLGAEVGEEPGEATDDEEAAEKA